MNRLAWLKERQKGIGGSDCAGVLGISKWSTPLDIYLSKVTPIDEKEDIPEHLYWGNIHEETIAREFQIRSGLSVQRRNKMYQDGCMIANIDRYVTGERAILECKTAGEYMKGDWGESGSDEVPDEYIVQCMHYMSITGYHRCYLAVLIGGNKFRWYSIPYREKLAKHLRETCVDFWTCHVIPRIPPDPVNAEDLAKLYSSGDLDPIEATKDIEILAASLKNLKEGQKRLKNERDELENQIKAFMGNASALLSDTGELLATWKAGDVTRLDSKLLKKCEPSTWEEFATSSRQRRFLLK